MSTNIEATEIVCGLVKQIGHLVDFLCGEREELVREYEEVSRDYLCGSSDEANEDYRSRTNQLETRLNESEDMLINTKRAIQDAVEQLNTPLEKAQWKKAGCENRKEYSELWDSIMQLFRSPEFREDPACSEWYAEKAGALLATGGAELSKEDYRFLRNATVFLDHKPAETIEACREELNKRRGVEHLPRTPLPFKPGDKATVACSRCGNQTELPAASKWCLELIGGMAEGALVCGGCAREDGGEQ